MISNIRLQTRMSSRRRNKFRGKQFTPAGGGAFQAPSAVRRLAAGQGISESVNRCLALHFIRR